MLPELDPNGPLDRNTLIGVAISIGGNILISLALNTQKLAHSRIAGSPTPTPPPTPNPTPQPEPEEPPTERTHLLPASPNPWSAPTPPDGTTPHHPEPQQSFLTSKLWWVGLMLMTLGEFGNFLSYAFAPASVVAPLGTFSLVANWLFAPLLLGESFRRTDVLGVGLAIIGAGTVVLSSRDSQAGLDADGLREAVGRVEFVVYSGVVAGFSVILGVFSELGWDDRYLLIDVGLCSLLGGFTVLSTKAVSSLLSSLLWGVVKVPIFWPFLVVLVVTCIGQLRYLNKALQRYPSKSVIPTQFCLFSLSAIVGSGVLYRDFDDVSVQRFLTFLLGLTTTFLGVFLLVPSPSTPSPTPSPSSPPTPPDVPSSPALSEATVKPLALAPPMPTHPAKLARLRRSSSTRGLSAGHILLSSTVPDSGGVHGMGMGGVGMVGSWTRRSAMAGLDEEGGGSGVERGP